MVMFRTICDLIFSCTASIAAHAEEGGKLVLDIDGQTYDYALVPSQSDWSGSESFGSVSIYANPVEKSTTVKSMMFGFSLASGTADLGEINLRGVTEGEKTQYFAGEDVEEGGLAVTVDSVSVSGDELSVAGSFQTRLGTSDNYGRDIDFSEAIEMQGTFDVVLGPVE